MSGIEFNQLLVKNADFLRPFALTLTRDNESARDLMQETLFRALKNREKYLAGTNVKAWMFTIMRNIFINNYRRGAKQKTIFDPSPNDFLLDHQQSATSNLAENILSVKEIKKEMHNLPLIFRKPFELFYEGYRYHEIADMLQEPLGTIKSRIHFARKLLKEQVKRY